MPSEESAGDRFATPRRLHAASIVLGIDLRRLVQNYLVPVVATFAVAGATLTVAAVLALAVVAIRVLAWQRFTYAFDGTTLRVDEGIVTRDHRSFDVERIQQVEVDRSLTQRLAGLATLRVQTAGGGGSETAVELRVIPESDAVALRAALRAHRAAAVGDEEPVTSRQQAIRRVPLRHVVLAAVTGARLLVLPAVVVGLLQFGGPRTDEWMRRVAEEALRRGPLDPEEVVALTLSAILTLVALVVAASVVAAVVVGVVRDANWSAELVDGDLHVSRGLFATRTSVLPLRRVQLVEVRRNWLRRLLRVASVRVSSAGGSGDGDRRVTVPLVRDAEVDAVLREVYGDVAGVPDVRAHPPAARRRAVLRWVRALGAVVGAVWLVPTFAPLDWVAALRGPSLGLLAVAVVLGIVEHRQLGHGTSPRLVASRRGALSVVTSLAPLDKVQAVTTRSSPFQRRLGLATVVAHVAGPGGDVEVLDADVPDAIALHGRLAEHAAGAPVG